MRNLLSISSLLITGFLTYSVCIIQRLRAKNELAKNELDRNLLFECGWVNQARPSVGFPSRPLHNVPPLPPGRKVRFNPPLKGIEINELKIRIETLRGIPHTSPYADTAQKMIKEIFLHIPSKTEHRNSFKGGYQPTITDLSPTTPPIHPSQL